MLSLDHIDLLPLHDRLTLRTEESGMMAVFDPVRRIHVRLTPEELVRQLWLLYLLDVRRVPRHRLAVERGFGTQKTFRFDLLLTDGHLAPFLLAEFKAPDVPVDQAVFDQVAVYNTQFNIPYALLSNGHRHYCFSFDEASRSFHFAEDLILPA
jgi:hypothetical protein